MTNPVTSLSRIRSLNPDALNLGGRLARRRGQLSRVLLDEAVAITEGGDPVASLERLRGVAPRVAKAARTAFEAAAAEPCRVLAAYLLSVSMGMGLAANA